LAEKSQSPFTRHAATVHELIDAAACAPPERGVTFLGDETSQRSWADLVAEARGLGDQMRALGAQPGDRIAIIVPSHERFVVTFLASIDAGLVPFGLYPPLSLASLESWAIATARVLDRTAARLVITVESLRGLVVGVTARCAGAPPAVVCVEALVSAPAAARAARPRADPDDPVFLQFTSGSTAEPRGVVVSHRNVLANIEPVLARGDSHVDSDDVFVSWLPLYHDMGLVGFLLAPLATTSRLVLLSTLGFVRQPLSWIEALHLYRGTITSAPNFAYARVTARARDEHLAGWDLSALKLAICGAEPINPSVMQTFVDRFAVTGLAPEVMCPSYGMAEATLAVTFGDYRECFVIDRIDADALHTHGHAIPVPSDGANALEIVGCGRVLPGHELAIVDDAGRPLPERRRGEIRFRGPSVTAGYFADPESTSERFIDGWVASGDLGYLADGQLFVCGRDKDVLIVNGRKYSPQLLEWQAEQVLGVRKGSVVAFAVPGQATEQVVLVAETSELDEDRKTQLALAVTRHISAELMLVVSVHLVGAGEIPKTSSGKLKRALVRTNFLSKQQ
jgi:fatty-acyl-CoA synthase